MHMGHVRCRPTVVFIKDRRVVYVGYKQLVFIEDECVVYVEDIQIVFKEDRSVIFVKGRKKGGLYKG